MNPVKATVVRQGLGEALCRDPLAVYLNRLCKRTSGQSFGTPCPGIGGAVFPDAGLPLPVFFRLFFAGGHMVFPLSFHAIKANRKAGGNACPDCRKRVDGLATGTGKPPCRRPEGHLPGSRRKNGQETAGGCMERGQRMGPSGFSGGRPCFSGGKARTGLPANTLFPEAGSRDEPAKTT